MAEDLGVVSVDRAAGGGEPKYIDDLFTDLSYGEGKRDPQGHHGFVIPGLKRREAVRRRAAQGSEAGAH